MGEVRRLECYFPINADVRSAANATSHLFFAYLRSLSPESARGANGILGLPRSLQQLVESTEYPPITTTNLFEEATKVVMIVDVVSPTPFALLRRAKNFEYRDDDYALQRFADYDDPIQALTEECRRVLKAISSTNQSTVSNSKTSTSLLDPSWSRFEDVGFGSTIEESDEEDGSMMGKRQRGSGGLSASPRSRQDGNFARPTTPSWADFLSAGFVENENKAATPMLLPPDQQLPPISSNPRGHSSQSHRRQPDNQSQLEPGELASIDRLDLDDSFWWVWISSLAGEEPTSRKAAFGRCALIETIVQGGKWMVMEEQVKGAAPEPATGAYIATKKGFLGFTTRGGRLTRRRSAIRKSPLSPEPHKKNDFDPSSTVTILPDQHAKIQAAAAELSRKKRQENEAQAARLARINNRVDANNKSKTNSMLSLQPFIMTEASPAMKWANQYDKQAIRAKYLGTDLARSESNELPKMPPRGFKENFSASTLHMSRGERDLPAPPILEPEPSPILEAPANHDAFVRDPSPAVSEVPSLPAPTAAPPPLPVEPQEEPRQQEAAEAAEIPLPDPTPAVEQPEALPQSPVEPAPPRPVTPQRPSSRLRKKSLDIPSPESRRRQQREKKASKGPPPAKSQQPSGFRQFFGTKKRSSKEQQAAPVGPPSPADPNPAIAAARAALEGRGQKQNGQLAPNNEAALNQFMQSKGKKTSRAVQQRPITPPASDHEEPAARSTDEERTPVAAEPTVEGPPRTRRDDEYDDLSRVDTNEREHADREFSTFDQGPLVEQPAFVPQEEHVPTPGPEVPGAFFTPSEETAQPPSYSVYNSVTAQEPIAEEHDAAPEELSKQVSPVDRWAQIRKNAAERAAKQSEEPLGRPSHTDTRTDDGETSGEESEYSPPSDASIANAS